MIHDEYLVGTYGVSWEIFLKKCTWIFTPCKKSPWGWAFYPTLSFNTRQSQGREKLLTNILKKKKKGNWTLKKIGAHGGSLQAYTWCTYKIEQLETHLQLHVHEATKQISHVLTLTLASFLGKKRTVSLLEESAPTKTHTYTHDYLIAFCTQHNFLKWIIKKKLVMFHIYTHTKWKIKCKKENPCYILCCCSPAGWGGGTDTGFKHPLTPTIVPFLSLTPVICRQHLMRSAVLNIPI